MIEHSLDMGEVLVLIHRTVKKKKNPKIIMELKNSYQSWEPVAHTCNPSYSGGSDQEDRSSNSSQDPI
jgi:hypothetical protein